MGFRVLGSSTPQNEQPGWPQPLTLSCNTQSLHFWGSKRSVRIFSKLSRSLPWFLWTRSLAPVVAARMPGVVLPVYSLVENTAHVCILMGAMQCNHSS